ncbi:hypothetical protein HJG60_012222 [Phyllostomus discolor]|uniref:Uncharacterized protein n=1 Tax=Phyllostomus discolor TaxID=89673 RepID=A0A833ZB52_9CHIR|nr:hypothetical protein HJG60_012222 [Phyllostomus discolor]
MLEDYMLLEICPFHLVFKFLGIEFFTVISYNPLYFCGVNCNLSSFISDCVYLALSLLFMMSLIKSLSILFVFSRNQLLDSLILRIMLLVSMPFKSALILVSPFLVLALGCLCCCSSSSFRCMVRFLFEMFVSSLGRPVSL